MKTLDPSGITGPNFPYPPTNGQIFVDETVIPPVTYVFNAFREA
jgi:hypothetical protein